MASVFPFLAESAYPLVIIPPASDLCPRVKRAPLDFEWAPAQDVMFTCSLSVSMLSSHVVT